MPSFRIQAGLKTQVPKLPLTRVSQGARLEGEEEHEDAQQAAGGEAAGLGRPCAGAACSRVLGMG